VYDITTFFCCRVRRADRASIDFENGPHGGPYE
jgi:hypothetical protein